MSFEDALSAFFFFLCCEKHLLIHYLIQALCVQKSVIAYLKSSRGNPVFLLMSRWFLSEIQIMSKDFLGIVANEWMAN